MEINNNSVPVVILQFNHGSLGIARTLGRLGVPIYAIDSDPKKPELASKYCTKVFIWDINKEPVMDSLNFLFELSQELNKPSILIPTSDSTTEFVAGNGEFLKKYYIFPHQSYKLVKSLTCKKEMYFLAKKHGVDTPEAFFPESREDLSKFLKIGEFPVMLKRISGTSLNIHNEPNIVKIHNEKDLLEQYDKWEDSENPNFMLQEYIPGGEDSVWMFNGYFNDKSECLIGITGKKIRQRPPYKGCASLGICLQNEHVDTTTRNFMAEIGYQGILDIGYRFDARDGKYKVLDINPRIGSSFRLFVGDNGLDVVQALYLHLTEQPVPPTKIVEGRKWMVEDQDLASCIVYYKDGKLTLKEFFRSLQGIKETAWFAFDDIKPFLKLFPFDIKKEFKKVLESRLSKINRNPPFWKDT